jgi:hypothetical protein
MKRIILTTVVTLFTLGAFAQVSKEDLAIYQSVLQKDKTDVIKKNLKLSDDQSKVFWPLYEAYDAKRLDLSNQRVTIINDYLKQFNTLTDQEATALVNRTVANDKSFNDLQKSYVKKFSEAIGGVNTAKLYQLEIYMQQVMRLHVQNSIPFIGEIK